LRALSAAAAVALEAVVSTPNEMIARSGGAFVTLAGR
jgi:hypothetical protein